MKNETKVYAAAGGILGAIFISSAIHHYEYYTLKEQMYVKARKLADDAGKPLLNVGCRWSCYCIGDTNVDIMDCPQNKPNFVKADATNMTMFKDKQFGAVFASHILEHLPDPKKALDEWNRVADNVVVLVPYWFSPAGWTERTHQWIFTKNVNPTADDAIRIRA